MSKAEIAIPLDRPDNHPVYVEIAENKQMGAHDVVLYWGNWKTKQEARENGLALAKILEEKFGCRGSQIQ